MRTRPALRSADQTARFNAALARPHTWQITGVDAFWLEDGLGTRLSDEFPNTGPVYDEVLAQIARGVDVNDLCMVGRRQDGDRSTLGTGLNLQDLAEAHAGIPARPRTSTE